MSEHLTPTDLNFVMSRVPRDVRELMKKHPLFLAGGFIRATIAQERPSDIDLLGPRKPVLHDIARDLALSRGGRVHETDNAFTILAPPRPPVQFIHRWTYAEAEQLIAEFDFTIAQAVIYYRQPDPEAEDGVGGRFESMCANSFYSDLASRRLVYTSPKRHEDAGGSLLRVRKFLERGYHIEAPALAAVISRLVVAIDWDRVTDKQDEEHLSAILCGLLREVDPAVVIDGVDLVDEHEVLAEASH